jgi:hypothetical protein
VTNDRAVLNLENGIYCKKKWLQILEPIPNWNSFFSPLYSPFFLLLLLLLLSSSLFFLVKRVPGRGPEQRESKQTVLCPRDVVIVVQTNTNRF